MHGLSAAIPAAILLPGNSVPIIRRYDGKTEPRVFAPVRDMSDTDDTRGPSVRGIPEGDNRERMICAECRFVLYDNPKIVVGSVPRWGDKILLCRRAIHPRKGYWTLPAGYLELNESTSVGPSARLGRRRSRASGSRDCWRYT